jgi:hypothetical protein
VPFIRTLYLGRDVEGDTGDPGGANGLVFDRRTCVYFDPSLIVWRQSGAPFGSPQTDFFADGSKDTSAPGVRIEQAPAGSAAGGGCAFTVNQFGLAGVPLEEGVFTGNFDASGAFGGDTYQLTVERPPLPPESPDFPGMCPVITITPATLDDIRETEPVDLTFTASDGEAPYTWDVVAGELPDGLVLSSGGVLTGAAATYGTYTFWIRVVDDFGCTAVTEYTLEVLEIDAITVLPADPTLIAGARLYWLYVQIFTAEGGLGPPYTFTIEDSESEIPPGLTFSPDGVLAGIPTEAGLYTFTVRATDEGSNFGEREYTLQITGLRIMIDGVDRTIEIAAADFELALNRQSTAHLEIGDNFIPARGADVLLYARDGITPIFGGRAMIRRVVGMTEHNPANKTDVDCVDYSVFLEDADPVTLTYTTDQELEDIIADIVDASLAVYGITYAAPSLGITVPPFDWGEVSVVDAFKRITDSTGLVFRVLPLKALDVFAPLADAAPVSITDAGINAFDLEWTDPPNLPRNTVDLLCGPAENGIATQRWIVDSGEISWEVDIQAVKGSASPAIAAHGFLGTTGNFAAGETVTLGSSVYTFRAVLVGDVAGEVLIGGTEDDSLANLIAAITGAGGSGYAPSTPTNTDATAYLRNPSQLAANAIAVGAAGNAIAVATTGANASWYGEGNIPITTLEQGSDAIAAGGWTQGYVLEDGTVARTIGPVGSGAWYEWDVTAGRGTVTIGSGTVAPNGTELELKYLAVFPFHARVSSGSPPVTFREAHPEIVSYADGLALATALLERESADRRELEVSTDVDGFFPGQALTVNTAYRGVLDDQFLVATVRATLINALLWEYSVTCQESNKYAGSYVEDWKGLTSGTAAAAATPGTVSDGGAAVAGDIYSDGRNAFHADQSMGGNKLRAVADPAAAQDAATKVYTDTGDAAVLAAAVLTDGSHDFTAPQSMGGNALTDVDDPTNAQDAATKAYVDAATSAFVRLAQVVTSGSQATVDFSSIPNTYRALVLHWTTRDTQAGTASVVARVRINNDNTAANYTAAAYSGIQNGAALAGTNAASTGGVFCFANPQDGNTAGIACNGFLVIEDYTDTTWHKRILSRYAADDATTNLTTLILQARWKSAAAINRLTVTTDGTAFKDGSIFTLYGVL